MVKYLYVERFSITSWSSNFLHDIYNFFKPFFGKTYADFLFFVLFFSSLLFSLFRSMVVGGTLRVIILI